MLPLIYIVLLFTVGVVYLTRHHDPSLLYRLTREDGLIEWATVAALVGLAVMLFYRVRRLAAGSPRPLKVGGLALAGLSLVAAGEEISWGQRLLGLETPEPLQRLNHQGETNLHNLMPAELFNGVIIFTVAIGLVLIPLLWRKTSKPIPWWLPSEQVSLLTLCVVLVNHYRVSSLIEQVGLVVLAVMLVAATVDSLRRRELLHFLTCGVGWATMLTLYSCRFFLPAANQQYEIRELLIVLVVIRYCHELLRRWEKKREPRSENAAPTKAM